MGEKKMISPVRKIGEQLGQSTNERSLSSVSNLQCFVKLNDDEWNTKLTTKLNELCSLRKGWDGYNARPPSYDVARFASLLLGKLCNPVLTPFPSIVPLANGGIQIEWHTGGIDLEIAIDRANIARLWAEDVNSREEPIDIGLTTDFTTVMPWIEKLHAN